MPARAAITSARSDAAPSISASASPSGQSTIPSRITTRPSMSTVRTSRPDACQTSIAGIEEEGVRWGRRVSTRTMSAL